MYRYSVDNAVTYTSEDFVLFRESPFASWMERLSLENPDHGIPPDIASSAPRAVIERQDDVAETLRSEDREVVLINWDDDEPRRRAATLDAMRSGVDFIVNGQLALGPLSGTANLLMRTSGYSDFGGFLYIPCDTQAQESPNRAFRLCFLADLLHSLQGQLPPQMLIIRGGADLESMQTEEHIYHYRAVKQRFMEAMRNFRKHRMPDPAESSHFGRWSDCANEVMRQRALRDDGPINESIAEILDSPVPLAATAGDLPMYELDTADGQAAGRSQEQGATALNRTVPAGSPPAIDLPDANIASQPVAFTLAEQALLLTPGAYAAEARERMPGSTPNLVASGYVAVQEVPAATEEAMTENALTEETAVEELLLSAVDVAPPELDIQPGLEQSDLENDRRSRSRRLDDRRNSDVALQNLQFIGSSHPQPQVVEEELTPADTLGRIDDTESQAVKPHPLDSAGFNISIDSVIDMDAPAALVSPPPVLETSEIELATEAEEASAYDLDGIIGSLDLDEEPVAKDEDSFTAFSDSLITNDDFLK